MGMNLSRLEDGEEFTCNNAFWNFILESAKKGGWEPLGTIKLDKDQNQDNSWNSEDYNSNSGQVVNDEDAHQISKSLKVFLSDEKENISVEEFETINRFIEWLKVEDYEDDGMDYFPGFEIY
jgi:hypothetical protein